MIRFLPRLMPIFFATLLSGCVGVVIPGLLPEPEPEAAPVRVLPAAVRAALLPGVPESIVVGDGRGCYLVSLQVTEPRQGYLVNDANGEPLCYDDAGTRIPRPVVEGDAQATIGLPAVAPGADDQAPA